MFISHGDQFLKARVPFFCVGFRRDGEMKRFAFTINEQIYAFKVEERTPDDSSYPGGVWSLTIDGFLIESLFHAAVEIVEP
jgi:hypothetical protein